MINTLILILTSSVACLITYIVNVRLKQGPIKASAATSFFVALLFYLFPHAFPAFLAQKIPAAFFGASFAGMSSQQTFPRIRQSVIAGFIFGCIFVTTSKFFTGYGGGLGTTACISTLITLGLTRIYEQISFRKNIIPRPSAKAS